MKKACCAAFLLAMLAQPVLAAEWTGKFAENYDKYGLDVAVTNALADKVKAEDILAHVMKNREKFNVNARMSMKSLYCASVNLDVVQETARRLGIAQDEINKALQESREECSSKMALQDRDIEEEKVSDNGNHSGGSAPASKPAQAPAAQPAQQQTDSGSTSTLIETRRDEEENPSPN